MQAHKLLFTLLLPFLIASASHAQASATTTNQAVKLDFHADTNDPYAQQVQATATDSVQQIQKFFGAPYPDPIHFKMVPDRAAFDKAIPAKLGMGATECWMVGFGTADLMLLLSPSDWAKQACEHDPKDTVALHQLITHELVHVYHGQFNPSRDFTGVDDLDWFVEGLAVFASGQLTQDRLARMQSAITSGKTPASLAKVWTGPDRYAFAGSLVRYVDQRWGRATTVRLLKTQSTKETLAILDTNESSLLAGWRASITKP